MYFDINSSYYQWYMITAYSEIMNFVYMTTKPKYISAPGLFYHKCIFMVVQ